MSLARSYSKDGGKDEEAGVSTFWISTAYAVLFSLDVCAVYTEEY